MIAVCDGIWPCWFADWLHACDEKWWNRYKSAATHPGMHTCCDANVPAGWAEFIEPMQVDRETGERVLGIAPEPYQVTGGGNSGHQAIEIAAKCGAKKIVLLGMDMKAKELGGQKRRLHYFGNHKDWGESNYKGTMLPYFEPLIAPLARMGCHVVNATPGSAIECFPSVTLREVFP